MTSVRELEHQRREQLFNVLETLKDSNGLVTAGDLQGLRIFRGGRGIWWVLPNSNPWRNTFLMKEKKFNLSYPRERLKEGFGAAAFVLGLVIDWTFEGRVKGWIGTSLQVLLPFVLAILTVLVVHEAYSDGFENGMRSARLKQPSENS